ncbi:DUF402 domain-containing protein [Candidatus Bathyarchaeota archaeon]|nr:DUF402 domain-containing protein [Candidatus Bathyarchaeota archaeon]MBS7628022.1 DUF402 domain-containing protein [Candidatus Bathyarchaeota archaeon]
MERIIVSYKRPPNRIVNYHHILLYDGNEAIVSAGTMKLPDSLLMEATKSLKRHYLVLWFNFPLAWHDIGAVYDGQGELRGYYCDIITPIRRIPKGFRTTDLFLDLWVFPGGRYVILDQDEFEEAIKRKWIGNRWEKRAKMELRSLIAQIEQKRFPPPFVRGFLEKASKNFKLF